MKIFKLCVFGLVAAFAVLVALAVSSPTGAAAVFMKAQMAPIMGIVPSDRVAAEAAELKKQKANKAKAIVTARANETKPDSRVKGQAVATR